MDSKTIIIQISLIAAVSLLVGLVIYKGIRILTQRSIETKAKHLHEVHNLHMDSGMDKWLKKRQTGFFSYYRISTMMLSTGEIYRQKSKGKAPETPGEYIQECFVMGGAGAFAAVGMLTFANNKFAWWYLATAIPVFIAFMYLPQFFMTSHDKSDNKKMLEDVNAMYEALKVSTTAGIPLTDGLGECYRQVANPRLKSALAEVSSSIRGAKPMEETINRLRSQFTSPEITQFCIVIRQALDTGRQQETLTDLTANMREVRTEINHAIEENLNSKVQLIQLSMLFLLMFTMLYAVMSTMTAQMSIL